MKTLTLILILFYISFALAQTKPYIKSYKPNAGTSINIYYLISNEGDTLLSSEADTLITTGLIYEKNNFIHSICSNNTSPDLQCWADKRKYFIGVKSGTCTA